MPRGPSGSIVSVERIEGRPDFLRFARVTVDGARIEVVARARLDTRQVLPFFDRDGVRHVGVLRRDRVSRVVRGAPASGLEPIGVDLAGVDETGDVQRHAEAIFTAHAQVRLDEARPTLPAPSVARSVGYLTELALPWAVPVEPPPADAVAVTWDGARHVVEFAPVDVVRARLGTTAHDEVLALMLGLVAPRPRRDLGAGRASAGGFLDRHRGHVRSAADLVAAVRRDEAHAADVAAEIEGRALTFLRAERHDGIEVVTPSTGRSVAVLPWVVVDGAPHFVLWRELRPSVAGREPWTPVYDSPVSPWFVNATARWVDEETFAACATEDGLAAAVTHVLAPLSANLTVDQIVDFGVAEPAPSCSTELRRRVGCALSPDDLALPAQAVLVRADELCRAVAEGAVRDPVVVTGLVDLGLDPFADVRGVEAAPRRAFVDVMTRGSDVLRRLRRYSSIEAEQLAAPTYARLMAHLQAEHGVRVAYPEREEDRGFFKAAFRVFMADDRGGDRALQGLHWSHDAYHFALGNHTPAVDLATFEAHYLGDVEPVAAACEGPTWEAFAGALKAAEDEATFFSFYTLFAEHPPLARHVPKLTYHAATLRLGLDAAEARAIFDAVTTRAELPARVAEHPAYAAEDVRGLFAYMLGFRDHHLEDIRKAYRAASKDPYRAILVRLGLYEADAARYVSRVRGFAARLAATPVGFDALGAHAADVRLAVALRGFDLCKALRLARGHAAIDTRARLLRRGLAQLEHLVAVQERLDATRREIVDAELSTRNERLHRRLVSLGEELAQIRQEIWDGVREVLPADVVARERRRELPR